MTKFIFKGIKIVPQGNVSSNNTILPKFTKEQLKVIQEHVQEQIFLFVALSKITMKTLNLPIVPETIFNFLPISKTISPNPEKFFDQPLSKTSFSAISSYMTTVTVMLLEKLLLTYNENLTIYFKS